MKIDKHFLVSDNLITVPASEVEELERELNLKLPLGYQKFMGEFGIGTYCSFIRVYPPKRIRDEIEDVRKRWDEYYFWDAGESILTKSDVLRCIIIADSLDGDELIQEPDRTDILYVLPRHDDKIYTVPRGFDAIMDWESEEKRVLEMPPQLYFEPWNEQGSLRLADITREVDFELIASALSKKWNREEIYIIEEQESIIFFMRLIGGVLQILRTHDDRIFASMTYELSKEKEAKSLAEFLASMGLPLT